MADAVDMKVLENGIRTFVKKNVPSGILVIFEKENIRRPPRAYISINLLTGPLKAGMDDLRHVSGTDDDFELSGQRTLTVSIKGFGEEAQQIMTNLQTSVELPSNIALNQSNNFAIWQADVVQDISAEIETGFEHRYQMDMMIGVASNIIEAVGSIQSTEIDGDVKDAAGTTVATPSIEAP